MGAGRAAASGSVDVLLYLLHAGVPVNALSGTRTTALVVRDRARTFTRRAVQKKMAASVVARSSRFVANAPLLRRGRTQRPVAS